MGAVETMPHRNSLAAFDAFAVNGRRAFMETCWLPVPDGAGIDAFITAMETVASPGCAVLTHEFKGFANRVPEDATAFGLRHKHVLVEILAWCPERSDASEEERHRQWARLTRKSFDPIALPGGYPNLLTSDYDRARIAQSYGGNAARLIKAKRRYDPDNVFKSAIPLPDASVVAAAV